MTDIERSGLELIDSLKSSRPTIAVTVERALDAFGRWNGDGPSPEEDGCLCYTFIVKAGTIVDGELIEGWDSLGGSWHQPGNIDPEINGYLYQMVEEAVADLDANLATRRLIGPRS